MKINKNSLTADIAFVFMLLLLFLTTMFISLNSEYLSFNIIALFVVFAVMLITRFTSITSGLLINFILIFVYMTYLIYNTIANGLVYGSEKYLWALISPMLTASVGVMSYNTQKMEQEHIELQKQTVDFATIDSETGLKSQYSYMNELDVFQSLARRHNLQVMLVVWGLRFDHQMKKMLSKDEYKQLTLAISKATKETFRCEDVIYVFQKSPFLWGTVTLVSPGNEDKIVARIHEKVEEIDLRDMLGKRAPKVELRIGAKSDELNNMEPEKMLESAIAQMQYDV